MALIKRKLRCTRKHLIWFRKSCKQCEEYDKQTQKHEDEMMKWAIQFSKYNFKVGSSSKKSADRKKDDDISLPPIFDSRFDLPSLDFSSSSSNDSSSWSGDGGSFSGGGASDTY